MSAKIGNEAQYKNKHAKPKCAIALIATILPLNAMFMFLILVIGISLLSLSVSTITVSAHTPNDNMSSRPVGSTQMGICVIGVKSACNT
jgi:hypothetical protein